MPPVGPARRAIALGIGIGAGYLFPTTFENEVYSDLVGERGVLMGALAGIMEAQYDTLRKHGHSPSEAFNETVEELTESLIRLVAENGMDWMYANCSATAQRGALDWKPKFKKAVMPVFKELYERVASGAETARVIRSTGGPDYKQLLGKELKVMGDSEMWQAGAATRALRPKTAGAKAPAGAARTGGRTGELGSPAEAGSPLQARVETSKHEPRPAILPGGRLSLVSEGSHWTRSP